MILVFLCIDDGRILGVKIEMSESSYTYLFQDYLPYSNHSSFNSNLYIQSTLKNWPIF